MRWLIALLLLANLLFLALAQGWLQPLAGLSTQREPQRLAAQLHAEAVRVVDAAVPGPPPPTACLEAGPFDAAQLAEAEALLAALPAGSWQRIPAAPAAASAPASPTYWLRAAHADAGLRAQLQALKLPSSGAFVPCAAR